MNPTDKAVISEIIDEAVKKAVKKTISEIDNGHSHKNFYKMTEKALYAIPQLKAKIRQDVMDIADLEKEKYSQSDWHEARPPSGPKLDDDVRHLQKIRRLERTKKRTESLLERIENALDMLKDDEDYPIIIMRYFEHKNNPEIAAAMNYHESTIARRKNRLMSKLQVILFGADALDI